MSRPLIARLLASLLIAGGIGAFPVQAQSQPQTWRQFVEKGGSDYIRIDLNLPNEFRDGLVYFNYGANQITAFILRRGLSAPPNENASGSEEIDYDVAESYVREGKAIVLNWNLGNSSLQYADDPSIRFPRKETGCLRVTCLTATFLNEAEIADILRSIRDINGSNR